MKANKIGTFLTSVKELVPGDGILDVIVFIIVVVAFGLFAFTTLHGNRIYCENLLNNIHKGQPSKTFMKGFRIVSALVVFIGAGMEVSMLWNISDVLMGVMALINIPVILI